MVKEKLVYHPLPSTPQLPRRRQTPLVESSLTNYPSTNYRLPQCRAEAAPAAKQRLPTPSPSLSPPPAGKLSHSPRSHVHSPAGCSSGQVPHSPTSSGSQRLAVHPSQADLRKWRCVYSRFPRAPGIEARAGPKVQRCELDGGSEGAHVPTQSS